MSYGQPHGQYGYQQQQQQPQPSYNQGGYGGQQTSYGGQQGYQQQQTGGYGQQQAGYNAGGFQQNRPPPQNTSNVSPEILQWFNTVDVDRSGQVSSVELKQALVNADNTAFDDDTIKMLISLFDTERNGTINVQEFAGIYGYIKQWQGIFANFDRDRSGTMDQNELQAALAQFGFNLGPRTINMLLQKYGSSHSSSRFNRPPGVTFDHFIRCCCAVKALTEGFQRVDPQRRGTVEMGYHQFLDLALAAP